MFADDTWIWFLCFFVVGHLRILFPCRNCLFASKFTDWRSSLPLVEQVVARMISIWPPKRPISLCLARNRVFSFPLNGFSPGLLRVPPRSASVSLQAIIFAKPPNSPKGLLKSFFLLKILQVDLCQIIARYPPLCRLSKPAPR